MVISEEEIHRVYKTELKDHLPPPAPSAPVEKPEKPEPARKSQDSQSKSLRSQV